jgi:exopolysaccharide production protein ExoQ
MSTGANDHLIFPKPPWMRLLAPAFMVTAIFVVSEHTLTISLNDHHAATQDEMENWTTGGDTLRQLAFLLLGGVGLIYARRIDGRRVDRSIAILFLSLLSWCIFTIFWSIAPMTSARRSIVLMLWVAGAIGFAIRFDANDLTRIVALVSASMIILGLLAELSLGTFRPLNEGYRFAGTVHPNTQASGCALLCLATGALGLLPKKRDLSMVMLMAIALIFLILTRSRTSLLAMILGAGTLWTLSASTRTKVMLGVASGWATAVTLFFAILVTPNVEKRLTNLALLGRGEQSDSLTGRLPLWDELWSYAVLRPLQGYGYQAFWTTDHIASISREMEWPITESHSAYIDALLQIGLIGLIIAITSVLICLVRSGRSVRRAPSPGTGFIFSGLVFGVIQATTESTMSLPMWAPWALACGISSVAFRTDPSPHRIDRDENFAGMFK